MMVSTLSNHIDNKIEQVMKRDIRWYDVWIEICGWVHQYTRVPPLAEAEIVGLVTGECPSRPELAGRLPLLDDGVPVVAPAKTAASKNSSIQKPARALSSYAARWSSSLGPWLHRKRISFIAAGMKRRISRTRTFHSRDEHISNEKRQTFRAGRKINIMARKTKIKSNRSGRGRGRERGDEQIKWISKQEKEKTCTNRSHFVPSATTKLFFVLIPLCVSPLRSIWVKQTTRGKKRREEICLSLTKGMSRFHLGLVCASKQKYRVREREISTSNERRDQSRWEWGKNQRNGSRVFAGQRTTTITTTTSNKQGECGSERKAWHAEIMRAS